MNSSQQGTTAAQSMEPTGSSEEASAKNKISMKQKLQSSSYWKQKLITGLFGPEFTKRENPWWKLIIAEVYRWILEFAGTLLLTFFIAGIETVSFELTQRTTTSSAYPTMHKALVGGFVLVALIYYCGAVSGAHLNPAITFAFTISFRFPLVRAIIYIIAQVTGAIVGAGLIRAIFGNDSFLGSTIPAPFITTGVAIGIEILITGLLCLVVLGTSKHGKLIGSTSGIAIGLALGVGLLFAWDLTGASMNPARSLGPAIISGKQEALQVVWIYIVGPLIGALIAVVIEAIPYHFLFRKDADKPINHQEQNV